MIATDAIPTPRVVEHDLTEELFSGFAHVPMIAWDIETTGLDWEKNRICTCQLYAPEVGPVILRINERVPARAAKLLANARIRKLFHFAMFDLRFMRCWWGVRARNVICTKIASKLLAGGNLYNLGHSLKDLLNDTLKIRISKAAQTSNWAAADLTDEQLQYAVKDVLYLMELDTKLRLQLRKHRLMGLASACYRHLPIRVELEVRKYPDVFLY